MLDPYLPLVLMFALAGAFALFSVTAAPYIGPRRYNKAKLDPYECGNEPESFAHDHRFSVRYYLIAVLFVIFDVETIFLFPWAVMFDQLALFGFIEMTVFLAILIVGYVYVWNRGALNWA